MASLCMHNVFDPNALDFAEAWPPLPLAGWKPTLDTVHRWAQIVGKIRLNLAPPVNHFWHCGLYVSPRGLTTQAIPYGGRLFEIEFDFLAHLLRIRTSESVEKAVPLIPRSVAGFHREVMAALQALGIQVEIADRPDEVQDRTPFPEDHQHRSYDGLAVQRFWRGLITADTLLQGFRGRYTGKASPVLFYWGTFDLAVSFYSDRRAPVRDDADAIQREAYSHEVASFGFWPGSGSVEEAALYAYVAPEPEGYRERSIEPRGVRYSDEFHNFILPWDTVRRSPSPPRAAMTFFESAWDAACELGGWTRTRAERAEEPMHEHRPVEAG